MIAESYPLPEGWKKTLPTTDHQWVSKALFHYNAFGKLELDPGRATHLWYHPPEPALAPSRVPRVDRYFAHRLLLWMPRKLWRVKLCCPNSACQQHELTSAGIYHRVRQVLDVNSFYNLAGEYLECSSCKKKYISWSGVILNQLDIGHRYQFPALLTYRLDT